MSDKVERQTKNQDTFTLRFLHCLHPVRDFLWGRFARYRL